MVLGQLDSHMRKNESGSLLHHTQKLIQNELKTWMLRPEIMKLLENTGFKLLDITLSNIFWIWLQRQWPQKQK